MCSRRHFGFMRSGYPDRPPAIVDDNFCTGSKFIVISRLTPKGPTSPWGHFEFGQCYHVLRCMNDFLRHFVETATF